MHSALRPVTAGDPAWFVCGDPRSPDYGQVFAQPVARGSTSYWFDRAQRLFALRRWGAPVFGETIELWGRLFRVGDFTDAAKRDLAHVAP